MTDADWLAYCLTAAAVIVAIIAVTILFQHYPIEEAINATYTMMVHP
jgi:hypothetical protein